ncbi:MAG: radical SAM protein [Betaproteobacteria bacterium]
MREDVFVVRERMRSLGLWSARQQLGRRWPVGCVALEVTQRCNLDCTACYLSESSQALHDLPLEELFRRIAAIRARYGPGIDLQITGGEPTLRRPDELRAIVAQARAAGLRPTLFTNGIRASRELLCALAAAGLEGVAFHVDTTQQRSGFPTEASLNALRRAYLARARGAALAVYFNTTVHADNIHEMAGLARFFVAEGEGVSLASFQLSALTGRGVAPARPAALTAAALAEKLCEGAATRLSFDAMDIGHPRCNRYAAALVANGHAYDALDDARLVAGALSAVGDLPFERTRPARAAVLLAAALARRPLLLARGLAWTARRAWRMRGDLVAARGRVRKLSFFIHDFMDACSLDPQRIAACSFMVATPDGPVSMCEHNAQRDAYLLRPAAMNGRYWDPVSGRLGEQPVVRPVVLTRKTARGRARL